jgi:hypothetical protein
LGSVFISNVLCSKVISKLIYIFFLFEFVVTLFQIIPIHSKIILSEDRCQEFGQSYFAMIIVVFCFCKMVLRFEHHAGIILFSFFLFYEIDCHVLQKHSNSIDKNPLAVVVFCVLI